MEEVPTNKPKVATEAPKQAKTTNTASGVELIVRQASRKWGVNEETMVRIARCESNFNPNAINYNYYENGNPTGLYQHISGYWAKRASNYGYSGASVFDPVAQANVTAQMFRDGLGHLWACK